MTVIILIAICIALIGLLAGGVFMIRRYCWHRCAIGGKQRGGGPRAAGAGTATGAGSIRSPVTSPKNVARMSDNKYRDNRELLSTTMSMSKGVPVRHLHDVRLTYIILHTSLTSPTYLHIRATRLSPPSITLMLPHLLRCHSYHLQACK